jgi:hypothetical protein
VQSLGAMVVVFVVGFVFAVIVVVVWHRSIDDSPSIWKTPFLPIAIASYQTQRLRLVGRKTCHRRKISSIMDMDVLLACVLALVLVCKSRHTLTCNSYMVSIKVMKRRSRLSSLIDILGITSTKTVW